MPAKKKKGGKKKKGAKKKTTEKKEKEEKKTIYEIPEYRDPKEQYPKVTLNIVLADPPLSDPVSEYLRNSLPNADMEDFKEVVRTNTRLDEIRKKIIEHHDGSIKDVKICLNTY